VKNNKKVETIKKKHLKEVSEFGFKGDDLDKKVQDVINKVRNR